MDALQPPASISNVSQNEDDDDDYMNMVIAEPVVPKIKETYTQRRLRKERESEARGRVKSKTEKEADAAAAREAALSRSLLDDPLRTSSSKGLAMMAKMGFKPGSALGRIKNGVGGADGARTEPIAVSIKEGRGGIGLDAEKKRKFREEVERDGKRVRAEEGEYRKRVRKEREDGRLEGLVAAAMRVAERMAGEKNEEEQEEAREPGESVPDRTESGRQRTISTEPLKKIPVLWRGLVKQREEKERDRRMRYDLHQSLSRLPTYEDTDADKDDETATGKDKTPYLLVEDLEEEDAELDEFGGLEPAERLDKLVDYLRNEHHYCFWCKYTYPDADMDGCPGKTEEDHD